MTDLPVLMALRVQGVAPTDRIALAVGVPPEDAAARVRALVDRGLAVERNVGRVSGFALTPAGLAAIDESIVAEGTRGDEVLLDLYERFCMLNERFLRVASDWQVRRHGPIETPNDHGDADYDQSVIDRLCELHDRACAILAKVCERIPRMAAYRTRLDECLHRVRGGDLTAFTAALAESYHTVWFELHQDLLLTLGVEREA